MCVLIQKDVHKTEIPKAGLLKLLFVESCPMCCLTAGIGETAQQLLLLV